MVRLLKKILTLLQVAGLFFGIMSIFVFSPLSYAPYYAMENIYLANDTSLSVLFGNNITLHCIAQQGITTDLGASQTCNYYLQYNDTATTWANISTSPSNIYLNSTNPDSYTLPQVTAVTNWTQPAHAVTITVIGSYNLRCKEFAETCSNNAILSSNTLTATVTDNTPPTYSLNSTNSTTAGSPISHNLYWADDVGLSGYIFGFDNGTGTFVNDSWVSITGAGNWSNVTKTVNSTVGALIRWKVYANDTSNNWNASALFSYATTAASNPYLEVSLSEPSTASPTNIIQNTTFLVNATVICRGGSCGSVSGTLRYNASSQNPDTPINATSGAQPLYIQEASPVSTKSCPNNPLSQNSFCNLTWTVNATDLNLKSWKIGANFSSNDVSISANYTSNATVSVVSCSVDITANWASIVFQSPLTPNTYQNPASGNSGQLYNITVNSGSCNTDLYIKGTDMQNITLGYTLGAGNLTWSNASNDYPTSFNMTGLYALFKYNVPQITNVTTWYWMNVPPIYAANYNGTVFIQGVQSGSAPP